VPTIAPGRLFTKFTTDPTLNIRWLTATDPAYYETLNRPLVDEALRTLILAKAVDALQGSLGRLTLYPFLVQPVVVAGTAVADVPASWIWDLSLALPKKWDKPRLAKLQRIAGENSDTAGYSGFLRLIFTANQLGEATESALFWVDYHIDSPLTYQTARLRVCTTAEDALAIQPDESETIAGTITFRTLDPTDLINVAFLELVQPPVSPADSNSDGYFDSPAVYEVADSAAGGATSGDYSAAAVAHGTGLLVDSAWAPMPALDSSAQSWLDSFNYPFDADASRISTAGLTVPLGMFREFSITAPAGDEPTGSSSGLYFPVWVSRIELVAVNHLRWYFATHNTTETETGGAPSLQAVEFASMDLLRSGQPGDVIEIRPLANLQLRTAADAEYWDQHFGRGHAVLSGIWSGAAAAVTSFFAAFTAILDNPQDTDYPQANTRLSSFAISRVPKYTPTVGQGRALLGSTSRRTVPLSPSETNRYVTEQDQGLGNQVDFNGVPGLTPVTAIDRYGYSGSLCHRIVHLVVDGTDADAAADPNFYDAHVLPRLKKLLGRDPVFGDTWFNGTRFVQFNGDSWMD